jgi:hypothetical protein
VFRDLHLALLYTTSIFGLTVGLVYLYIELSFQRNGELQAPLMSDVVRVEVREEEETCSICREKMMRNEEVVMIVVCKHLHHKECFGKWICVKRECPICRVCVCSW